MLNLFAGSVSTCSLASHIALEEAGAFSYVRAAGAVGFMLASASPRAAPARMTTCCARWRNMAARWRTPPRLPRR